MEQPAVVAGNFALSFSLIFFSIFVHISGSFGLITLQIWASLERSFPPADIEYRCCQFWSKVVTSEVEERPKLVMADYGRHGSQWVNWNFQRGRGRGFKKIPSVGEVWILSGITNLHLIQVTNPFIKPLHNEVLSITRNFNMKASAGEGV